MTILPALARILQGYEFVERGVQKATMREPARELVSLTTIGSHSRNVRNVQSIEGHANRPDPGADQECSNGESTSRRKHLRYATRRAPLIPCRTSRRIIRSLHA